MTKEKCLEPVFHIPTFESIFFTSVFVHYRLSKIPPFFIFSLGLLVVPEFSLY